MLSAKMRVMSVVLMVVGLFGWMSWASISETQAFSINKTIRAKVLYCPSSPQYTCVNSPSGNLICIKDVNPTIPLGNKIPLILIHGWNKDAVPGPPLDLVWENYFLFYFNNEPTLRDKYKAYTFSYYSNDISIFDLGGKLRDVLDIMNTNDPTNFGSKQVVIMAHSMGGLVSRSFMQQHWQLNGVFGGKKGSERVIKLITLGTPHHGTPLANGDARDNKAGFIWLLSLSRFDNLMIPSFNQLNRSNMHWDNYENNYDNSGLIDYNLFPNERNTWLINELNNDASIDNKIIAYAGSFPTPTFACGLFDWYCYGNTISSGVFGLQSDGVVPVNSGLFYNQSGQPRGLWRFFDEYNHTEMWTGKGGDTILFDQIRQDLETIQIPPTVPPSPTLVSPGSDSFPGSSVSSTTPTFQWQPVSTATEYDVYISQVNSDGTIGNLVFNSEVNYAPAITNTPFTLPSGFALTNGGFYRWNMRAKNGSLYSSFSTRFYFQVNTGSPIATTNNASNVTSNAAQVNGSVNPSGFDTSIVFEYGTTTGYGSQTPSQGVGAGTVEVPVSANLSGLAPNTTYHFRLKATNSHGASFGIDRTFFTAVTPTYGIYGRITDTVGVSVPNATVTLSGGGTGTTTTSSTGTYSFTGRGNGAYTVTPTKASYSFTPINRSVTISNGDATGQDFSGIPTTAAVNITFNKTSINFGTVPLGNAPSDVIIITNPSGSTTTLTGSVGTLSAPYSVASGGGAFSLSPGQSRIVAVTFTPTSPGGVNTTLVITHNSAGGATNISLSGTGGPVLTVGIVVSPSAVVLDNITLGNTGVQTVTITNPASSTGSLTGTISNLTSPLSITGPLNFVGIPPGASHSIDVRFFPTGPGVVNQTLVITSNAGGSPTNIPITAQAARTFLTFNPASLSFGSMQVGQFLDRTVTLTNESTSTSNVIGSMGLSESGVPGGELGGFSVLSGNPFYNLAPGQSNTLVIRFAPNVPKAYTGNMAILHNSTSVASPINIPITATGLATQGVNLSVTPASINFGTISVGQRIVRQVTVTNNTDSAATLFCQGNNLSGQFLTGYPGGGSSFTLEPGASRVVLIHFAPTSAGTFTQNLTFTHNAVNLSNPLNISMTGTAVAKPDDNWVVQRTGNSLLNGVYFTDANNGWAVGNSGNLLHTTNGGTSWTSQNGPSQFYNYRSVYFADANNGWACGYSDGVGRIIHTTDGGATWSDQFNPNSLCWFITGLNSSQLFTATDGGLLVSTDSGATWQLQSIGPLRRIRFATPQNGWIVTLAGQILRTTNGGTTWQTSYTPTSGVMNDIGLAGSKVWGFGSLFFKSVFNPDGDSAWQEQEAGATDTLQSASFVDTNKGWAVGDGGTILKTTNGGQSWVSVNNPSANGLYEVFFNSFAGWAVGANGTILKYTGPLPAPDFTISTSPGAISLGQGATALSSCTLQSLFGFSNPVTLTANNLPAGATATTIPNPTMPVVNGSTDIGFTLAIAPTTPTGTYSTQLMATDGNLTRTANLMVSVSPCSFSISPTSQMFQGGGGTGTVTITSQSGCPWSSTSQVPWISITSGSLNSGSDTMSFRVGVNTDGTTRNGTVTIAGQSFTVTQAPCPQIAINQTSLPGGTVGAAYSQNITASGGTGPYTVTVTAGMLPPGLTLAADGTLSGSPTTTGNYSFTVKAAESGGCFGSRDFSLGISGPPTVTQFFPVAATTGKTITVFGTGFVNGNTQVLFGGTRQIPAAAVTVMSPTILQVVVPPSSTGNGNINGYLTIRVNGFDVTTQNLPENAANPGDSAATFPEFILWGDATGDGQFATNDVALARAFLQFQATPTARQRAALDVIPLNSNGSRGNGQLTATDLTFLRAVSFGQTSF
ncbi:MAG: choice-of-anchor D domain-containing protein [Blastocatellia bacterium]|nr:choice-of-anchor D domain-containing protein [Blastocatellia bacterium]